MTIVLLINKSYHIQKTSGQTFLNPYLFTPHIPGISFGLAPVSPIVGIIIAQHEYFLPYFGTKDNNKALNVGLTVSKNGSSPKQVVKL
jgi:hypothetical protein